MNKDNTETILFYLKKFYGDLIERKVKLSQAPWQDDSDGTMFWTLKGVIRDIWRKTEDYTVAELRGTKLLTSILSHASDICKGKVSVLDYDNQLVFRTELGLSAEMKECVEEARNALTTVMLIKNQVKEEEKTMAHLIDASLQKAISLHETVLSCQFEETPEIKMKLFDKFNGNKLMYSTFLTENIITRCIKKLHEQQSSPLKEACSHIGYMALHTQTPNTCVGMDIDNDDQMPLVSNRSDQDLGEVKVILCKVLQGTNIDAGELQGMSSMRLAEEIDHRMKELNQRLKETTKEMEERQTEIKQLKEAKAELSHNVTTNRCQADQLEKQKSDFDRLKDVNSNLLSRIDVKDDLLKVKDKEIEELKKENEDYLSRLSQYTSAQLTHNNPNVADLSDSNRPTKLAERFSELYDNEWTDAFDVIKGRYHYTEDKTISSLLYILTQAYEFCVNCSTAQDQHLALVLERKHSSFNTAQGNDLTPETELSTLERNVILNLKRRAIESSTKSVKEDFLKQLQKSNLVLSDFEEPHVKAFALSCAEICWHMVLHSPSLIIESSFSPTDSFSLTKYKYYKTKGTRYKYIVWPVLYLHLEGAILSKGVAEAE